VVNKLVLRKKKLGRAMQFLHYALLSNTSM